MVREMHKAGYQRIRSAKGGHSAVSSLPWRTTTSIYRRHKPKPMFRKSEL